MATTNIGLQCPVCQRSGFTSQSIIGHTRFCLEKQMKTTNAPGFVHHQSNNPTKPNNKPLKKQRNNNRGQSNNNGPKGIQKGKIRWDRAVIDVDLTSDAEDNDDNDDFVDGHHPMKKKPTGEHISSSSSSSSSSCIGTGKENRAYQEQSHIIDLVNTTVNCNNNLRSQGQRVNGPDMMGAVHSSNIHQPTTLRSATHQTPVVQDVPLTLQQNIEQMALRTMAFIQQSVSSTGTSKPHVKEISTKRGHYPGLRVVTPPSLHHGRNSNPQYSHDTITSPILQSNHFAASYAWNGWRSAVIDEMQGLERLHSDLMEKEDHHSAISSDIDDRKSITPTHATLVDTMTANSVQSNISVKSSSQIAETPVHAGFNTSNDVATTIPTDTTTDAVWTSMLVHASLTVDQLALSAASRLGLKPAMLARLIPTTAPSQPTQSNRTAPSQPTQSNRTAPTQTAQSNRTAPTQINQLDRPPVTLNGGSIVHITTTSTNQQSNTSSSSSALSYPSYPSTSSSPMGLDRLGKAVVVKLEGSTLRDGIDIDDSNVLSRLDYHQIVYFDTFVVVPAIEGETIAVMRLHVLYAVDAPPNPLSGQGPGLDHGMIRPVNGWVSVAGRIPEEDVAPIVEILRQPTGGAGSETSTGPPPPQQAYQQLPPPPQQQQHHQYLLHQQPQQQQHYQQQHQQQYQYHQQPHYSYNQQQHHLPLPNPHVPPSQNPNLHTYPPSQLMSHTHHYTNSHTNAHSNFHTNSHTNPTHTFEEPKVKRQKVNTCPVCDFNFPADWNDNMMENHVRRCLSM